MSRKALVGLGVLAAVVVLFATPRVLVKLRQPGAGQYVTNENFEAVAVDPEAHRGADAELVGLVFQLPDSGALGSDAFQMSVDPRFVRWTNLPAMVVAEEPLPEPRTGEFVRVRGQVEGAFEGENFFGEEVTKPEVRAESVEIVSASVLDPAKDLAVVDQARDDGNFQVRVDNVEFGEEETRVYVTVRNGTDARVNLRYGATLILGPAEHLPQSPYAYDWADVREPETDLAPGEVASGLFAFRPVQDQDEPLSVRLSGKSEEDDDILWGPLVFEVSP